MYELMLPIGNAISKNKEPIDSLIKQVKYDNKDKKGNEIKGYVLKMVIDLIDNCIRVIGSSDTLSEYDPEKSCKDYLYAGNNGRRDKQYYLTRDIKSSNYLFGKVFFDLNTKLKEVYTKEELDNNQLFILVEKVINSNMYNENLQTLDISKIEYAVNLSADDDNKEKLNIFIKQSSIQIINKLNFSEDKFKKVIMITPAVRSKNNEKKEVIELVKLPEYKELLEKQLVTSAIKTKQVKSFCYLCKEIKTGVTSHFNLFFKIFTKTTINSASDIVKNNYHKNFKICSECYQKLKHAENYIKDNLGNRLGGVSTYVIPQSLSCTESICAQDLTLLSNKVELAFNEEKFRKFAENIEYGMSLEEANKFALNFVSYDTDGNYFKVINQIHDVPELYFSEIVNKLAKNYMIFNREISGKTGKVFHLGSIYQLIPIRFNKESKIVEKNNVVLELYSQIFNKIPIAKQIIFKYFCSAIYAIRFEHQDVFKNLRKGYSSFDFAVKDYFYRYLMLINTLRDLNLIKEEENMTDIKKIQNEDEWEDFLEQNNFNVNQRALFYLGVLLNQVSYSQYKKGHKDKPILRRITYQGMSLKEIKQLYIDIFEKLVQYKALYSDIEKVNSLCKRYFDESDKEWFLNENENVFYLLSGYAYKVSRTIEEVHVENNDNNDSK